MKKILITGSTTGLGQMAGQILLKQGHEVIFHARSSSSSMKDKAPYVIGDLSKLDETKSVAEQANAYGTFDAVIHNAGVYIASSEELFAVNVIAPYALTCLMKQPKRMVILSSGLHLGGAMNLDQKKCSYSDTKLFALMLAKYLSRQWPGSYSNAVNPGWVPTRMGGAGAPDDLVKGAETQAWLSVSEEASALVSGKYFFHQKQAPSNPLAESVKGQESLIAYLEKLTGISIKVLP